MRGKNIGTCEMYPGNKREHDITKTKREQDNIGNQGLSINIFSINQLDYQYGIWNLKKTPDPGNEGLFSWEQGNI